MYKEYFRKNQNNTILKKKIRPKRYSSLSSPETLKTKYFSVYDALKSKKLNSLLTKKEKKK